MKHFALRAALASSLALSVALVAACSDSSTTSTTGASGGSTPTTTSGSPTTSTSSSMSTSTSSSMNTSTSTGTGEGGNMPTPDYDCTAATGTVPTLKLTSIASGLTRIVQTKSAPDNLDRLYVVQKTGVIRVVDGGKLLDTPFIDLSGTVMDNGATGEEGLLGLAFDPDYATNGRFFVHYSEKGSGDNIVAEYHRSDANHLIADTTQVAEGLRHITAQDNHNGGAVEFGPDGFLYVSMGDGGNQGDPECDAQLSMGGSQTAGKENLFGKISRIDVNQAATSDGFPAAAGNPNGGKAFNIGFRNPWRIDFDVCTGDLWVGDVGQDTYEEVDHITAAESPVNGGWPYREGTHAFTVPGTCPKPPPPNLHEPLTDYKHDSGRCSISGGYVYRSSAIPALRGAYFFGDYCTGEIWYIFPTDAAGAQVLTAATPGGGVLSSFGQDGHGNVYVGTLDGNVFRIDAN